MNLLLIVLNESKEFLRLLILKVKKQELIEMIQMIYNDTSDRSGCQRKRAASEILMMTSSVMPWRRKYFLGRMMI